MYRLLNTFDDSCFKDGVYTVPEGITEIDMSFLYGREGEIKKIIFPETLNYIEGVVNLININELEFKSDFHLKPEVFRMCPNIRKITIDGHTLEANENESMNFYGKNIAKVNNDGIPTLYDRAGQELEIKYVDDNLYNINPNLKRIFVPRTVNSMGYIDISGRNIDEITFEDIKEIMFLESRIFLQDGNLVNESGKNIATMEKNEPNYLFTINGELAFYNIDEETGKRKNICIYDSKTGTVRKVVDTLELKKENTTRFVDVCGVNKLVVDTPELIGFIMDDNLTELEIKNPISEIQRKYVNSVDEEETFNYDFSSGWKNLKKIKLGSIEFEVPSDEEFTYMSNIAYKDDDEIYQDLIINTKNDKGCYTYAYNEETNEFERYDTKDFVLSELDMTEEEFENLIAVLKYERENFNSIFLDHTFNNLSFERLKKYIDIIEPGLYEKTVDYYRSSSSEVIDLMNIENIIALKQKEEMEKQKEDALKNLCLTEKDYQFLVLELKRCKIMHKTVETVYAQEENAENVNKLREYIEYKYPELKTEPKDAIGTERITFDEPITPEILEQHIKLSEEEIKEINLLSEKEEPKIYSSFLMNKFKKELKISEKQLKSTPKFRFKKREELESHIAYLKFKVKSYDRKQKDKEDEKEKIRIAKEQKEKLGDDPIKELANLLEEIKYQESMIIEPIINMEQPSMIYEENESLTEETEENLFESKIDSAIDSIIRLEEEEKRRASFQDSDKLTKETDLETEGKDVVLKDDDDGR